MDLSALQGELARSRRLRLTVKVTPGSARTEITGRLDDGTLKVRVAAPPERGKANAELRALLGRTFGVAARNVTIASGEASPLKRIVISL